MDTQIDLNTLSKEQLFFLVQVRGQALQMHRAADDRLFEIFEAGELTKDQAHRFMNAKLEILGSLAIAEEQILAGYQAPPVAN
ncbi:hypothetical protein [Rhizobium sp. SL86]|uniref:hypothetical protein n=1 Tax=Rhizobium sp. SL86 TaxID=2995148 RepID=UPI0022723757|nr:hypothetical protein [Rhizobium sp. SL86]MCY1668609.1 hypothetical protein [Rhizobium sp. SL86]